MAYVEWQDWMSVGVPLVDRDHQVLIRLINQAHDCIGDAEEFATLGSVLRALADYTDYHFQREERLQQEIGYPGLAEHQNQHARLSGQVREIIRRYDLPHGSLRALDVQSFLGHWLSEHILNHDRDFRRYALGHPDAEDCADTIGIGQIHGATATANFEWKQIRVLVVDDNPNFLTLMETILVGVGVGYFKAVRSGAAALDVLKHDAVDAVLSDWRMDVMDGLDLVSAIRRSSDPIIANVAVLMLSGRQEEDLRRRAAAVGVDEFLDKPVSARDLLLRLAHTITRRRS